MPEANRQRPDSDAKPPRSRVAVDDFAGERRSLLLIGMAAVAAACLVFAVARLAVTLETGAPTPWWANAAGLAVLVALYLWQRRSPEARSGIAAHGTALVATIALLVPIAYGMTSTVWWLSLVGFAMVLLGRRAEALVWGIGIPVIVVLAVAAGPFVRLAGAPGESRVEAELAKTAFVVLLVAMAAAFRRLAERRAVAIRESEERYRSVFSATADGILVFDVRSGSIEDANPAACRMYGYTRDELRKTSLLRLSAEPEETARALQEKTEFVPVRRQKRRDGSEIHVEITARTFEIEGRRMGVLCSRDIGARLAAEQHARRLSAAIEQVAEAVVITDLSGTMLYVNPAFERSTGYTAEEAIGQNPRILSSGRQTKVFYEGLWNTLLTGFSWSGHLVNRRKDGRLYEEEATISPVRDSSGAVVNYVGVKRDVSAEIALKEQLAEAQRIEAVGRLAGGVAHDFNNLLTVILGNGELLRPVVQSDAEARGGLDELMNAGQRAAALTAQLLAFGRRQMLELRQLDLVSVLSDIREMLTSLVGEQIELAVEFPPGVPPIRADRAQIEQVIVNLVLNARHAMKEGGSLSISLDQVALLEPLITRADTVPPGTWVTVEIRDTGHGMDAGTIARIFEPFFTTKPFGSGTGLGLATVYGIVKQTGGFIEVQSAVGKGTRFRIFFSPAASAASTDVLETGREVGGSETILVVEDEPSVRALLEKQLGSAGYAVLSAENAQVALELAGRAKSRIDLLVTDVVLPGTGGPELARQLGDLRRDLKVLLISGYSPDSAAIDAAEERGWSFLPKPFSRTGLLDAVRGAIRRDRTSAPEAGSTRD
jgi:two-component system, cell cycle sensor histidine kinase and response regulator CckA